MYEMPAGYDEWKTREPDYARVVGECAECGDEILEGHDIYKMPMDGETIHADCFDEYARRILEPAFDVA